MWTPILKLLLSLSLFASLVMGARTLPFSTVVAETDLSQGKIMAPLAVLQARFGGAVAAQGDLAVLGAPGDTGAAQRSGAAYVAQYEEGQWRIVQKLSAVDGQSGDSLGAAVAIGDGFIVVGAPGAREEGRNSGAVYLFRQNGDAWVEEAKLLPNMAGDARFGATIAADGNRIVVGAPFRGSGTINSGAVYVIDYLSADRQETVRITSGSAGGAVLSDLFGWAVDLDGDRIVVGAYLDDLAYVYSYADGNWTQSAKLRGAGVETNDRFGYAVALDGDLVAVGAPQDDDQGNNAGAAYLFALGQGSWNELRKISPTSLSTGSRLGWSVAVKGTLIAAGAREDKGKRDLEESGSVYLYELVEGNWREVAHLTANDAASMDHFGESLAFGDSYLLVGAPDKATTEQKAGAVYTYLLQQDGTTPDPTATPTATALSAVTATPTATSTATPTATPTPTPTSDTGEPPPPPALPITTDCEAMSVTEQSQEQVLPGVIFTWDSVFHCREAPLEGSYGFSVTVSYIGEDGDAFILDKVLLTHTTPRPLGESPFASLEVEGLPLTLNSNSTESFRVWGDYRLVETDEGAKANLHFCADGYVDESADTLQFGLNAHLRNDPEGRTEESPVVSDVIVVPSAHAALVRWQTNEPTFSRLAIAAGADEEPFIFSDGCELRQQHEILVNNLESEAHYVVQIRAPNADGVVGVSDAIEFVARSTVDILLFLPSVQQ